MITIVTAIALRIMKAPAGIRELEMAMVYDLVALIVGLVITVIWIIK